MHAFTLALAAVLAPGASPDGSSAPTAEASWRDGTVLVLRDSNSIVETVTDSRISHVALVFRHGAKPVVYEATPGKVRRLAMAQYLKEISVLNDRRRKPMQVYALRPRRPYNSADVERMKAAAFKKLGARYSVKSYVRDKPGDGVHCSEFAARVLSGSERHAFRNTHKITPVRLTTLLAFSHRSAEQVKLPSRDNSTWCQRTSECWGDFWDWCGWASVETVRFGF